MKTKTELLTELAAKMQREAEESKTCSPYSLAAKVTIFYAAELAAILAMPDDRVMVSRGYLLELARSIEALKLPCGLDPETTRAIQNGRYMSVSYNVRALIDAIHKD